MPALASKPIKPDSLLPCLAGHGFSQPTYTQTPNDLFAAMPWLSNAELRVLLILVRYTLGYHRTTCQASITDIARETGLSRPTVISTAARLCAAGLITRIRRYPQSQWRLNITQDTHISLKPGEPVVQPDPPRLPFTGW